MKQYLDLLKDIIENGNDRGDRTGVGTRSVFGRQLRFNLQEGFPLVTTKKVYTKGIIHELLWFISGDTNVKYLQDNDVHIWDEWATKEQCAKFNRKEGDLGPIYSHQWNNFGATKLPSGPGVADYADDGINQLKNAVDTIKNNPDSRRIIVTGWNPKEANQVTLPPCHTLFQFYVERDMLSCQLYARSIDSFLGLPFNIASYGLLTSMVAQVCNLKPKEFIITFGDVHLYKNHFKQAYEQIQRTPRNLPKLILNKDIKNIEDFRYEDIKIEGYRPHPAIKAPVAV